VPQIDLRKALLIVHHLQEAAQVSAAQISQLLNRLGCEVATLNLAEHPESAELEINNLADVDLAVSLGGDGCMLRSVLLVGDADVPVLGVNYGRLG